MVEPTRIREVNFVIAGMERRLGLLQVLILAAIGMLGGLIAGALAIYVSVGDVKTSVAVVQTKIDAMASRLAAVEQGVSEVRSPTGEILTLLRRIDQRQPSAPTLSVTEEEAKLIRQTLGTPDRIGGTSKFAVGDVSPPDAKPLPEELAAKIPRLRGVRVVLDGATNALALIDPTSNRVFAII